MHISSKGLSISFWDFLIDNKGGDSGIRVEVGTLAASINNKSLNILLKENVHYNILLIKNLVESHDHLAQFKIDSETLSRIVATLIQGLSIQKMVEPRLSTQKILKI